MKPLQSLALVCVRVWERKPNMPHHPSAQDAHQGKLLPLPAPASVFHTHSMSFLGYLYDSDVLSL